MTFRNPQPPRPCRYHKHVCASVLPEYLALNWVHMPEHDYEMSDPDKVGGLERLFCVAWAHDLPATEMPPEPDHGLLEAVASLGGE